MPESLPVLAGCGMIYANASSWPAVRAATVGAGAYLGSALTQPGSDYMVAACVTVYGGSDFYIYRAYYPLLAGSSRWALGSDLAIHSSQYGTANGHTVTAALVESTQASPTGLVAADFGAVGSVELSDRVTWTPGSEVEVVFPLNQAGIDYLNAHLDGSAMFALREVHGLDDTPPSAPPFSPSVYWNGCQNEALRPVFHKIVEVAPEPVTGAPISPLVVVPGGTTWL
jgi:hypothetical protein